MCLVCLSLCLSACLCFCLTVCLCVWRFVCLSVCLSLCLSVGEYHTLHRSQFLQWCLLSDFFISDFVLPGDTQQLLLKLVTCCSIPTYYCSHYGAVRIWGKPFLHHSEVHHITVRDLLRFLTSSGGFHSTLIRNIRGFTGGWTMGPSAAWFYEGQLRLHWNWTQLHSNLFFCVTNRGHISAL